MTNFIGLSKSLPINALIATQLWFEGSPRAGSSWTLTHVNSVLPNENLLENIGFGDIHGLPVFTGFPDLAPEPTALTREQTDEAMGDFTMELDHENALFDHSEYGDVPDGIAPHIEDMSALDRIIFEDCVQAGEFVQAPHPNINDVQYFKRPETIARKCACTIAEAKALTEAWAIIGDTEELVGQFIQWTKARGAEAAITYFINLADELLVAEDPGPEDELNPNYTSFEDELFDAFEDKAVSAHGRAMIQRISDTEIQLMTILQELADRLTEAYAAADYIEPELDGIAPELYRYHPIGIASQDSLDYYEDIAPFWMKRIIAKIERCSSLDELKPIGKQAFEAHMGMHAGTFWMHYGAKKVELTPETSRRAAEIIDFIGACKTRMRLGKVGKRLYELQAESQRVEGNLAIADSDWSGIWKAYRARKDEVVGAQPAIYE